MFFSQGFTVFRGKNSPCAESAKTAQGDQQSQRTEGMNVTYCSFISNKWRF